MQDMSQTCVDIHNVAKEAQIAQNIPANIYFQSFALFNMKQLALNEKDSKPMNNYQLGKLVLNWIENYLEDFEQCDKIKSLIDDQFEKHTASYIYKIIAWYLITFIVPYYFQLFG